MRRYVRRRFISGMIILWGLLLAFSGMGVAPCFAAHRPSFALNENCCFWMVSVEAGQTVSFSRRLEAGTRYRLFVMSDSYSTELSVSVIDPLGTAIARSDNSPRETLLCFTPSATGTYLLRLTVNKARGATRCSALLLPEQGDWKTAHFHWSDALKQIQQLFALLEERGLSVELPSHGVCMVGGFVPVGRAVEFGSLTLDSANYLWAAVGDSRVRSLQMTLQRDDRDASKGGGRGKPLALCAATQTGTYTPSVTLWDADAEVFVIVAILKLNR